MSQYRSQKNRKSKLSDATVNENVLLQSAMCKVKAGHHANSRRRRRTSFGVVVEAGLFPYRPNDTLVYLRDGLAQIDYCMCCHIEIGVADRACYTDAGPTSPSKDPVTPGAPQSTIF